MTLEYEPKDAAGEAARAKLQAGREAGRWDGFAFALLRQSAVKDRFSLLVPGDRA